MKKTKETITISKEPLIELLHGIKNSAINNSDSFTIEKLHLGKKNKISFKKYSMFEVFIGERRKNLFRLHTHTKLPNFKELKCSIISSVNNINTNINSKMVINVSERNIKILITDCDKIVIDISIKHETGEHYIIKFMKKNSDILYSFWLSQLYYLPVSS